MTTPEELYWNASRMGSASLDKVEQLREAAEVWASQGYFLAAGIAWSAITHAGWGLLQREVRLNFVQSAINAFNQCVEQSSNDSMEAMVALKLSAQALTYLDYNHTELVRKTDDVQSILAKRLISHFDRHPHAVSFLVRGFRLCGPITGPWEAEYPDSVVDDSSFGFDESRRIFLFRIPSAFRLLVRVGNYPKAREISMKYTDNFVGPDLEGWYHAVEGFTDTNLSAESFQKAAEAFAGDTPESNPHRDGAWTSINRDLWAPYFRCRSWMARLISKPERAEEFISEAAACVPIERTYSNTHVHRYNLFIKALAGTLGVNNGLDSSIACKEYETEIQWFGGMSYDSVVLNFIRDASNALARARDNRAEAIVLISPVITAMDDISPLLGELEVDPLRRVLGRHVAGDFEPGSRLWIYRTLESIRDEKQLRKILLRLFQESIPLYAQLRHGPFEYGKDLVIAVRQDNKVVLRMYQVKCGEIKKPNWNAIRPQLEEMFQVPLETFQISDKVHRRVGILVWNGHANSHVELIMDGWLKEQQTSHQRQYEFMHLDDLVNYVIGRQLAPALTEALTEAGVRII